MVKFICISESKKLFITGNLPQLGLWNIDLPMQYVNNIFEINIDIPASTVLEYKFKTDTDEWEVCNNHLVEIPHNSVCVTNILNEEDSIIDDYLLTNVRKEKYSDNSNNVNYVMNNIYDNYLDDDYADWDNYYSVNSSANNKKPFVVSGYKNSHGTKTKSYIKNNKVEVEGYTRSDGTEVNGYTRRKTTKTPVSGYTTKSGTKVKGYLRKPSKK